MTPDPQTRRWWSFLRGVSLLNIALWAVVALTLDLSLPYRQAHLVLAGVYVLVCAFRSFYPRIDLERQVLVDHWLSGIALGRSAATLAEMGFTLQLSLVLLELSPRCAWLEPLAWGILPLITIAEVACWYGVLSGNHLWHALEETLWGLLVLLLAAGGIGLWPDATAGFRALIVLAWLSCLVTAYVMLILDVPMYFERYRAEKEAGQEFSSFKQGLSDAISRREPTGSWEVWRNEVAWMTPYFSAGVWLSLLLARFSP